MKNMSAFMPELIFISGDNDILNLNRGNMKEIVLITREELEEIIN
jgi:hypothetical protein